jgi:cytochrome c-type biogenesis protein CcmH
MKRLILAMTFVVAFGASTARAVLPDEVMSDPAREARARALSQELRCMVCQNQSIDDSEAPLARDLRLLVRERIAAGDSDAQVIDFLVARYGEFVLLRPRLERQTFLLWFVPPLVLFGGGLILWLQARRRNNGAGGVPATEALTPEEQARLELLMADGTVPTVSAEKGSEARG